MRLIYDAQANSLRLMLDDEGSAGAVTMRSAGVVDVATDGRLVGIEFSSSNDELSQRRRMRRWLDDPVAGEFTSVESDGSAYIELTTGAPDDDVRSSVLDLLLESTSEGDLVAVVIPRHGPDYEISYPSGNR